MPPIDLGEVSIVKLSKVYDLSSFDCGDPDLNDFIKNDALQNEKERITRTFLAIYKENVTGFFSLVNDSIRLKDEESDGKALPRMSEYPATKIARIAVIKDYQGKSLGKSMIKIAIGMVLECKHAASRFITVDSYPAKVGFYSKKFNFIKNLHGDYKGKDNYVSMRYDLLNPGHAEK